MQQHTLAATYLKGFVQPETPPGREPALFVHNIDRRSCKLRAPGNISKLPNYYSWTDEHGVLRHDPERSLSVIETAVTPILRNVLPARALPDDEQVAMLALFVGTTMWRVPHVHEAVRKTMTDNIRAEFERRWLLARNDPAEMERWRKHFETTAASRPNSLGGPCASIEELMAMLLDPQQIGIVPDHGVVVGRALQNGLHAARQLGRVGWRYLVAPAGTWFVTSNKPGGVIHPEHRGSEVMDGPASDDNLMAFPLSRELAVVASPRLRGRHYGDATRDDVWNINFASIQRATHVFAPAQQFLAAECMGMS